MFHIETVSSVCHIELFAFLCSSNSTYGKRSNKEFFFTMFRTKIYFLFLAAIDFFHLQNDFYRLKMTRVSLNSEEKSFLSIFPCV